MLRSGLLIGLFLCLGSVVLGDARMQTNLAQGPAIALPAEVISVATEKPRPPLSRVLRTPIDFKGMDDKNTTLQEAMDFISDRYDVCVVVNEAAFKAEGVDDVMSKGVAADKPIPKMKQAPLETVFRRVFSQVKGVDSGVTYLLRGNVLELTTGAQKRAEIWGPDHKGPFLPLVHASIEERPLDWVLRDLAEAADFSIVLGGHAKDKAKTEVSGRFVNTPLDTAVLFLADMAELRPVLIDNALYVTSRENAAVLEARERAKQEGKDKAVPRIGLGRLAPPPPEPKP
jgi:hypothetical protein